MRCSSSRWRERVAPTQMATDCSSGWSRSETSSKTPSRNVFQQDVHLQIHVVRKEAGIWILCGKISTTRSEGYFKRRCSQHSPSSSLHSASAPTSLSSALRTAFSSSHIRSRSRTASSKSIKTRMTASRPRAPFPLIATSRAIRSYSRASALPTSSAQVSKRKTARSPCSLSTQRRATFRLSGFRPPSEDGSSRPKTGSGPVPPPWSRTTPGARSTEATPTYWGRGSS